MKGVINPGNVKDASESLLRAFSGAPRCQMVGVIDFTFNYQIRSFQRLINIEPLPFHAGDNPPACMPFGKWFLTITANISNPCPITFRLGMSQEIADDNGELGTFRPANARFLVNKGSWDKVFLTVPFGNEHQAAVTDAWSVGNAGFGDQNGPDLFNLLNVNLGATGNQIAKIVLPEQNERCAYQFFPYLFTALQIYATTGPGGGPNLNNHWIPGADFNIHLPGWQFGLQDILYPDNTILGTLTFHFTRLANHPLFTTSIAPPRTVVFTNRSLFNPSQPMIWDWDFGDGSGHSSAFNAIHTYPSSGSYVARLTATDPDRTKQFDQIIDLPLKANFTVHVNPSLSAFVSVNLTNTSIGAVTYDWDWGDGSPHSSLAQPTHVYPKGQTFTITLIIGDGTGKTDSKAVTFTT